MILKFCQKGFKRVISISIRRNATNRRLFSTTPGFWKIVSYSGPTIPLPPAVENNIACSDGKPVIGTERGGYGSSSRLMVSGYGFIDITDIGNSQLRINDEYYNYTTDTSNGLELSLVVNESGQYTVSNDNGDTVKGAIDPFPDDGTGMLDIDTVSEVLWGIESKYIPYQNIPDEPGQTPQELATKGRQYFPFVPSFMQQTVVLPTSLYDWTTASFTRIGYFNYFIYTGVDQSPPPQDSDSIATAIYTSNWETYTPYNEDYMNSFMMTPVEPSGDPEEELEQVQEQLEEKHEDLYDLDQAQTKAIKFAVQSLPRTSVIPNSNDGKPLLYSGQVDIYQLGTSHFATYFEELPANSNSSLPPLEMDLEEATGESGFLAPGNTVTLKSFMAFTDTLEDATTYSNGIIVILHPREGDSVWKDTAYITPFSDGPNKTEYLLLPGTQVTVLNVEYSQETEKTTIEVQII